MLLLLLAPVFTLRRSVEYLQLVSNRHWQCDWDSYERHQLKWVIRRVSTPARARRKRVDAAMIRQSHRRDWLDTLNNASAAQPVAEPQSAASWDPHAAHASRCLAQIAALGTTTVADMRLWQINSSDSLPL